MGHRQSFGVSVIGRSTPPQEIWVGAPCTGSSLKRARYAATANDSRGSVDVPGSANAVGVRREVSPQSAPATAVPTQPEARPRKTTTQLGRTPSPTASRPAGPRPPLRARKIYGANGGNFRWALWRQARSKHSRAVSEMLGAVAWRCTVSSSKSSPLACFQREGPRCS